jgi:CSLREA domain-containing protein
MRRRSVSRFNRSIFMLFALMFLLVGSAVHVTPVQAAGIVVNTQEDETTTNGACSLREAIHNANDDAATFPDCPAGSGADTITFAGNYTITLQGSQLPAIVTDITINGKGPQNTIIQASACNPVTLPGGCIPVTYRVFQVKYPFDNTSTPPGKLSLDGVSVRHGQCDGNCPGSSSGGGIYLGGGTLAVMNSNFSDNLAQFGGGIAVLAFPLTNEEINSNLTVSNSTFSGNSAGTEGGGLFFQNNGVSASGLTVTNSTFSGNTADYGGGMYVNNANFGNNLSAVTVTGSTFTANNAFGGGGLYVISATGTVANCSFSSNLATTSSGGGIWTIGTLTVTNSTFSNNSTVNSGGGAISNYSGTLTVNGSSFSGNSVADQLGGFGAKNGGAILNNGMLAVNSSTFSSNSANGGGGGAIWMSGEGRSASVTDTTFSSNAGREGGAINAVDHSTLEIERSTFTGNSATSTGGGISTNIGGTLAVSDSTFSANTAAEGGGIYFRRSNQADVTSSTFSDNSTTTIGGGIRGVESGSVNITNSTFSANTADTGGGLGLIQSGVTVRNSTFSSNSATTTGGGIQIANTTLKLMNTIVANSLSGGNCAGGILNEGNNLDSGVSCRWGAQKGSMSNTDPRLGPLARNGGPTWTHALLEDSPAIDKGDDTVCSEAPVNGRDQRGVTRPQRAGCDIGAYEKAIPSTPSFGDVPANYWAWEFIERLYAAGITGGCSTNPLSYCPEGTVTRAQMAIFLLRGIHTSSYAPPGVGDSTGFGDVSTIYWAAVWIKQLAAEGITTGCGNGNYCPEDGVTRAQMALFLLRSKYGAAYVPPAVGTGTGFSDVPTTYWAAAWIKQLVAEGITSGCGTGTYCPESPVTRAQMAVFLVRIFNLP